MRDVNLTIAHGEFVAIVGTSGSGKSTMMNILGCLDRPTRGTYTLAGHRRGRRARATRAPSSATASSASSSRGSTCCRARRRSRTASCRCSTAASARARGASAREAALDAGGARRPHGPQAQPALGRAAAARRHRARARHRSAAAPRRRADGQPRHAHQPRGARAPPAAEPRARHHDRPRHPRARHRGVRFARRHDARRAHRERRRAGRSRSTPRRSSQRLPPAGRRRRTAARASDDSDVDGARASAGPVPFARLRDDGRSGDLLGEVARPASTWPPCWGSTARRPSGCRSPLGEVVKAWVGARWARRRLGHPPTNDQRVRIALWYTLGVTGAARARS